MAPATEPVDHFRNAQDVRDTLIKRMAMGAIYKSWPNDFAGEKLREAVTDAKRDVATISVMGFTNAQCRDLGFGLWDEESGIRLLPVWLYPFLHNGDVLTSIGGETVIVRDGYDNIDNFSRDGARHYINNNCRFGCLAYGIVPDREA